MRTRDGRRLAFASVHFKAGGGAKSWTERQAQWATLAAEIPDVGERLRAPVIVAGDFNSTGYLKTDSHDGPPLDFDAISDHCPVRVEVDL